MKTCRECGELYRPERTAKDIARLLRKDITEAQKSGRLALVRVTLRSSKRMGCFASKPDFGNDESRQIWITYEGYHDYALEREITRLAGRYRCFYPGMRYENDDHIDNEPASNIYLRLAARYGRRTPALSKK